LTPVLPAFGQGPAGALDNGDGAEDPEGFGVDFDAEDDFGDEVAVDVAPALAEAEVAVGGTDG